ncbi:MAG: trypsin-like peptidase domain-containing protein [Proteobacteria bacterium]|nr:trypsin-like peptidase domain-containing protein [Pseudomonadota bacterium]
MIEFRVGGREFAAAWRNPSGMARAFMPPPLLLSLSLASATVLAGWGGVQPAWAQHQHAAAKMARPAPSPRQGGGFAALVASRSAAVVEIHTLRGWRGTSDADADSGAEFMPDGEFADRLAWPLPTASPYAQAPQARDLASGFIVAADGLVMTSAHALTNAEQAQIRLADGRLFDARLVGSDPRTDVALLRIDARGLPTAPIGSSARLRTGDRVAAIGSPFGFAGSVTSGVVSAKDRFIGGAGEVPFIQTDVPINPGSSGSPLFDGRGEVVALNSMIYTGSGGYMGVSFAVPIDLAMRSMSRILASGGSVQRVHLGAQLQALTPPLARSFGLADATGALVAKVEPGSAADDAGLAMGDVLTTMDGRPVAGLPQLLRQISEHAPGSTSLISYWRQGALRSTRVLWPREPERAGARPAPVLDEMAQQDGLGLRLAELSVQRRQQLGVDGGLLVQESGGTARSEGIRAGDVVMAVNDRPVARVEDFRAALADLPAGRPVALLMIRDRRLTYVAVRTEPPTPLRP